MPNGSHKESTEQNSRDNKNNSWVVCMLWYSVASSAGFFFFCAEAGSTFLLLNLHDKKRGEEGPQRR